MGGREAIARGFVWVWRPDPFVGHRVCRPSDGRHGACRWVRVPVDRGGVVRRYRVEVAPGKVRVASSVTGSEQAGKGATTRGAVGTWSGKSRMRMVETMASLDWGPVVNPAIAGWRPAMLTLTLPGDWLAVAPTGQAFKALLAKFWKRWARACWCEGVSHSSRADCPTRHAMRCVWKLEFQRRGAPHVHIYCAVPSGRRFAEWLSRTWYEVVGSGDERHLRAGTGVDWGEGIRASDPKRLAVYFLKRATGHNLGRDKEYQHHVPLEWQGLNCPRGVRCDDCDHDGGPGRFWGYKGLDKAAVQVELAEDQYVQLRRLLRRWAKANGRPVRSLSAGHGLGGMVLVNDAASLVAQAARWEVLQKRTQSGQVGRGPGRRDGGTTGEAHAGEVSRSPS